MQNDAWLEFFTAAIQQEGLTLSDQQSELFLRYMLELLEWNRSTNLTRIVEPRAIAIKHFLDSILITRYIDIQKKNIADIGSGGGFPGIPLAILEPSCSIVLIETLRKKTSFLKHVSRTLKLENVRVFTGRAQSYPEPHSFDMAVSRAFASLSNFSAIAAALIKPQGRIVCMKGQPTREEIKPLEKGINKDFSLETHSYCLPEQGDSRTLIVLHPCFT